MRSGGTGDQGQPRCHKSPWDRPHNDSLHATAYFVCGLYMNIYALYFQPIKHLDFLKNDQSNITMLQNKHKCDSREKKIATCNYIISL